MNQHQPSVTPPESFSESPWELPALNRLMLRYAQVLATQTAETARANGCFRVEIRLARWLLMAHDRTDGNELGITHDYIAAMLGVRRPGVTVALHVLEGHHMIRSTRGRVRIVDRAKLEEFTAGSYGLPEAEFRRLVVPQEPAAVGAPATD